MRPSLLSGTCNISRDGCLFYIDKVIGDSYCSFLRGTQCRADGMKEVGVLFFYKKGRNMISM